MISPELITAIAGTGGALTVVGGGVKFVWNKLEARFAETLHTCSMFSKFPTTDK